MLQPEYAIPAPRRSAPEPGLSGGLTLLPRRNERTTACQSLRRAPRRLPAMARAANLAFLRDMTDPQMMAPRYLRVTGSAVQLLDTDGEYVHWESPKDGIVGFRKAKWHEKLRYMGIAPLYLEMANGSRRRWLVPIGSRVQRELRAGGIRRL
jgi:hypothetical protein